MDMKDFIAEPWNFRRKLWSWIKCCRLVPPSRSALGMKEVPTLDEGSVSLLWLKAKGSSLSPGLLILWEWEWMEMQEWMAEGAASSWLGGRAAVSPWHPRNPPGPNSRLWGIPGIQQILLSSLLLPLSALFPPSAPLFQEQISCQSPAFPSPRLSISAHPAAPPQAFPLPSSGSTLLDTFQDLAEVGWISFLLSAAAWRTFQVKNLIQQPLCSLNFNSFADTPHPSFSN